VFGIGNGAYAEYARGPEAKLDPKPANLVVAHTAAVPTPGLTALQAVGDPRQRLRGVLRQAGLAHPGGPVSVTTGSAAGGVEAL